MGVESAGRQERLRSGIGHLRCLTRRTLLGSADSRPFVCIGGSGWNCHRSVSTQAEVSHWRIASFGRRRRRSVGGHDHRRGTGSACAAAVANSAGQQLIADGLDRRTAPGLADATLLEIRVGIRPVAVDGHPVLGPVPGRTNVHVATGYGTDRLLLGAYSAALVAGSMTDEVLDPVAAPFVPS